MSLYVYVCVCMQVRACMYTCMTCIFMRANKFMYSGDLGFLVRSTSLYKDFQGHHNLDSDCRRFNYYL